MRRFFGALAAVSAIAFVPSAANAVNVVISPATPILTSPPLSPGQTATFIVSGNPSSGPISATFGDNGIPAGTFTDMYNFVIPQTGLGSGSVTTVTDLVGSVTDVDIASVVVSSILMGGGTTSFTATPTYRDASNTICFTPGVGTCGQEETFAVTDYPIVAGAQNTITVTGTSRGNGSYSGVATFTPTPSVPEPATWAMMLLGFGAVGLSMRRRRRPVLAQIA